MQGLGFTLQANSVWATQDNLILAGATDLHFPGLQLTSSCPLGLDLDLASGKLIARIDGPISSQAALQIKGAGQDQNYNLSGKTRIEIWLPLTLCQQDSAEIDRQLNGLNLPEIPDNLPLKATGNIWQTAWNFDKTTRTPERVRDMTVNATPLPTGGIADELIDTVTLESRDIWSLWPKAPEYKITLTFPGEQALESLKLIGDSKDAPVFKVFNPLPAHIKVEVSNDGFKQDVRTCPVEAASGEACFKHFYGTLDRMETRKADINQMARQVRITLPAPEEGRPLTFQEIEVYGSRQVRPVINHLISADLA